MRDRNARVQRRCSAGRVLCVLRRCRSIMLLFHEHQPAVEQVRSIAYAQRLAAQNAAQSRYPGYFQPRRNAAVLGHWHQARLPSNAIMIGCEAALVHRHVGAAGAAGSGPGAATASCIRLKHTVHSRVRGTGAAASRMGVAHRLHARIMVCRRLFPGGGNVCSLCRQAAQGTSGCELRVFRRHAHNSYCTRESASQHTCCCCSAARSRHFVPPTTSEDGHRGARHRHSCSRLWQHFCDAHSLAACHAYLRVRRRSGRGSRARHCGSQLGVLSYLLTLDGPTPGTRVFTARRRGFRLIDFGYTLRHGREDDEEHC